MLLADWQAANIVIEFEIVKIEDFLARRTSWNVATLCSIDTPETGLCT